MLSYQHSYHAGNFADVLKHLTLCEMLSYLTQKESPLFYFESHAGRGMYRLNGPEALKTQEASEGILKVIAQVKSPNAALSRYFDLIRSHNKGHLSLYPGSACFAKDLLRPQDRMYLCELHQQEFIALHQHLQPQRRLSISKEDGLTALTKLCPPPEKRGLFLIDPSFELPSEYQDVPRQLQNAYKRFPQGVYCLWYPILSPHQEEKLQRALHRIGASKWLNITFSPSPHFPFRMKKTGLFIINPPYTLKDTLNETMRLLCQSAYPDGTYQITQNEN